MKIRKLRNTLLLVVLTSVLVFSFCTEKQEPSVKDNTVTVKTATVMKEEVSIPVHSSGKLSSSSEIKLSFKTGGIIRNIYKDDGDKVKRGEILAKLNLSEINSQVAQAREGFQKAERDLNRIENLYKDSVVTLEQLQNMRTAFEVAKSNLNIAEFNKEHSTITAPTDGIILKRYNEAGEIIGPGAPVFLFGSENSGWIVKVGITDKDVVRLSTSDSAVVKVDAYPGHDFKAFVTEVGASANPHTGTFEVELTLVSTDKKLSSGFVAKVDISPSQKEVYKTIPIEALFEAHGNEGYVFTYDPKTMTSVKTNITIKKILSDKIIVASGLDSINEVITDGVEYLSGGQKVIVK